MYLIHVSQLASIQSLNHHQNPGSHLLHQLLSRYHIEIYIHRHWYTSGYYDSMYIFIFATFALADKTPQNRFGGRSVIHPVYGNVVYFHPPTMSMWGQVNSCAKYGHCSLVGLI